MFNNLIEYAWEVIRTVANEVERSEVGSISAPSSPLPEPVRRISEEAISIMNRLSERRFTLARQTSMINEINSRASVDLSEDEGFFPRSRKGSLYPACAFIEDFAEANERERRASLAEISGLEKLTSFRRPSDSSLSGTRPSPSLTTSVSEAIQEDEETCPEDGKSSNDSKPTA